VTIPTSVIDAVAEILSFIADAAGAPAVGAVIARLAPAMVAAAVGQHPYADMIKASLMSGEDAAIDRLQNDKFGRP